MLVRPGRLLPSVIVGALVTGALALGAGTASAADTCVLGTRTFELGGEVTENAENECLLRGEKPTLEALLAAIVVTPGGATDDGAGESGDPAEENDGEPVINVPVPALPATDGPTTPSSGSGTESSGNGSAGATGSNSNVNGTDATGGGVPAGPAAGAPPSSGMPAPDIRGLAAPMAAAAPGGLAAMVPTLNFGAPSVGLLAPLGSPLRPLTGLSPASPVTTTSDVQAMALDSVPGGLGTPAVVGTLILSALAAFALRHRVLHRARKAAEADTVETPGRASAS